MVRCADFYEKWKRDPNWCEKSPDTVAQIDHYLELTSELEALGVDPVAAYKKFPEGTTAREVLKIKDPAIRETAIFNAAGMIKRGEKVTASDVKVWAGLETKPKKTTPNTDVNDPTIAGNIDNRTIVSPSALPGYEEKPLPAPLPPDAPIADKLKRDNELLNAHISQAEQYRIKQKAAHEEMDRLAVAFTELLTQGRRNILNDFKEEHKEYTTLADVFIYMIDMLAEKKVK